MFESNYFTMLMKPTYGKYVDTAEDIIDRGLTIVKSHISAAIVEDMKNSSSSITRELAERTLIPIVIVCYIEIF